MDTTYIYIAAFIAIAVIIGLAVSGKLKLSLSKDKLDFEASKQEAKNQVSATNITNESEVKIKKGDNHDITVDKVDGKSTSFGSHLELHSADFCTLFQQLF